MSKVKKSMTSRVYDLVPGDELCSHGKIVYIHQGMSNASLFQVVLITSNDYLKTVDMGGSDTCAITREVEKPDEVEIKSTFGNTIRVWDYPSREDVVALGPFGNTFSVVASDLIDAIKQVKGLD